MASVDTVYPVMIKFLKVNQNWHSMTYANEWLTLHDVICNDPV